jgi:hypothetical protein
MSEPFSWGKFFDFSPLVWLKGLKVGTVLAILAFVGFFMWRGINNTQHQSNVINAQPGAVVNVGQTQNAQKKRPWWLPHLFTEIYAFQETDRNGVGAKGGARWEW